MSAPGGLCESCHRDLKWCFQEGEMWVFCPSCPDMFGTDLAVRTLEGREAVMPDGRPCRSIDGIVSQDAAFHSFCKRRLSE